MDEISRGSSCGLRLLLQGELVDVDVADPKRSSARSLRKQASFLLGELLLGEDPGVAQGRQFA